MRAWRTLRPLAFFSESVSEPEQYGSDELLGQYRNPSGSRLVFTLAGVWLVGPQVDRDFVAYRDIQDVQVEDKLDDRVCFVGESGMDFVIEGRRGRVHDKHEVIRFLLRASDEVRSAR